MIHSSSPLVSILLPTHNRSDTLRLAIASLLAQTVEDFELFVVGDGCTDDTPDVVQSFDDNRITWLDLPKAPGFGYGNRNEATARARGRFMAYLGHDDIALPDHLERLLNCFENPDVHFAYSRPLWILPKGEIVPGTSNLHEPSARRLFLEQRINTIPAGNAMYRDESTPKKFHWNPKLTQQGDWDLWIRILNESPGTPETALAYLPVPTCLHFTADWRTLENAGPPENADWLKLHEQKSLLPPELHLPVPENELEQESFWDAITQDDPAAWTANLRLAVAKAIDVYATFGGQDQRPLYERLEKAEHRADRLRGELDRKKERIAKLESRLEDQK
ncbi:MAG: glycosyltransferase family A protein [Verrucomicrobiota bacterium]